MAVKNVSNMLQNSCYNSIMNLSQLQLNDTQVTEIASIYFGLVFASRGFQRIQTFMWTGPITTYNVIRTRHKNHSWYVYERLPIYAILGLGQTKPVHGPGDPVLRSHFGLPLRNAKIVYLRLGPFNWPSIAVFTRMKRRSDSFKGPVHGL